MKVTASLIGTHREITLVRGTALCDREGMFSGFDTIDIDVPGARIHARTGGRGEPLLLLHGWPHTHALWHELAPKLAEQYRVVVPDLRGYGESRCHDRDFTFRAMAADQVALMAELGHDSFHIVAHDRGARATHRLVLDHPGIARSVALLDILPTLTVWETMDAELAKAYYHWMFLSLPDDAARTLINGAPVEFLHHTLARQSGTGSIDIHAPAALDAYEASAQRPSVVDAWCGDYTAGATIDCEHDRADAGRSSDIPALIVWGSRGVVDMHRDPLQVWRTHFPNATGQAVDAGHALIEELPEQTLELVRAHLAAAG